MDELLVWLRAQLDEDARIAKAACWDDQSDVWTARPPRERYERYIIADYLDDGVVVVTPENADADGVGQHVAEHDPARVLREVEAKRAILRELPLKNWHEPCISLLQLVLALMAAPYSDRPGYQEGWAP